MRYEQGLPRSMRCKAARSIVISALVAVVYVFGVDTAIGQEEFQPPEQPTGGGFGRQVQQYIRQLTPRTGEVVLGDAIARISLDNKLIYLDGPSTDRYLVDIWGNPPGMSTLGMIMPSEVDPLDDEAWGIIISWHPDGYFQAPTAAQLDPDLLLEKMRAVAARESQARQEIGENGVSLVGWVELPTFDVHQRALVWAQEYEFAGKDERTVNCQGLVLGRRGALVLKAVGPHSVTASVSRVLTDALRLIDFAPGERYHEFVPGTDKVAPYGIERLIIGDRDTALAEHRRFQFITFGATFLALVAIVLVMVRRRRRE